jgi:hypothetical protein
MEELMPQWKSRFHKPKARHDAETRGIPDELSEITSEIELAMLAVIGLGEDLDDSEGHAMMIAGRLSLAARDLKRIMERLSPIDIEATRRALAKVTA